MILQYKPVLTGMESKAIADYLATGGWLTEHTVTREFEEAIAKTLQVGFCHAVTNGTIGLYLALKACGVESGDQVIVPALSMIATANAVLMCGAEPVFVDVDKRGLLHVDNLKFTDRTKVVIYVALNGRATGLQDLYTKCKDRGVMLIEDACQAFGSKHDGKHIGTIGDIGVFSLSAHKIITTGQGGLIVTNSPELNLNIARLKDFGREWGGMDIHDSFGINAKFTDLQAAIGLVMLKDLAQRICAKWHIWDEYIDAFKNINAVHMIDMEQGEVPWFVDIYVEDREGLVAWLDDKGFQTRPMYPPMYTQKCYAMDIRHPFTETLSYAGLWLPSSLDLKDETIEEITSAIIAYYD